MIVPWSVRHIGALGDDTVELLSDVPDPRQFAIQNKLLRAKSSKSRDDFRKT